MRLEPGEAAGLPLASALVDLDGDVVSATPEWTGPCPGTVTYHTGHGYVLVAPDAPTPHLDSLMDLLRSELLAAAGALGGEDGRCASVLAAGLELVAGRPVATMAAGSAEDVVALALAAIRARAQGLVVQVVEPLPRVTLPAPAAIALAVLQLAVNAQQHERARRVRLRVDAGPTFAVEWPGGGGSSAPRVTSHRHTLRRHRWGWGYVQMVADALGGTALPPGPAAPGVESACLGLGSARLTLPLACVRDGVVERATQAWEQETGGPALGRPAGGSLARMVAGATAWPGRIVYHDLYRARLARGRTWVALAPESGSNRARDVLRGLRHERALLHAPEPHATRLAALTTLLQVALGEPWPSVSPGVYTEALPAACAALGVGQPQPLDAVQPPDPWLTAFLLSELGGDLVRRGEDVYLVVGARAAGSRLLPALRVHPGAWLRINP